MSILQKLVLASGSPRRIQLLQQAGIEPDRVFPTDVDETPQRAEHPRSLAKRLSRAKAEKAWEALKREPDFDGAFVLAADTVVAVGRRILPKAELTEEASNCLKLLSGRAHRVYSGVCLITPAGKVRQRLVETRVRFKRFSREDLESYLASGEWRGKAGAYAVQGLAGSFVVKLVGSYTNVVGLPLYETVGLLAADGYKPHLDRQAGRPQ
jgi:septum formation protein